MFNTLKLGWLVESINLIPTLDNQRLIVFELYNMSSERRLFRMVCKNEITLNLNDYINKVITGVLYDDLNKELHITFENLGIIFDEVNIDSLAKLNNY